jgi:hypothetical protein
MYQLFIYMKIFLLQKVDEDHSHNIISLFVKENNFPQIFIGMESWYVTLLFSILLIEMRIVFNRNSI